MIWTTSLLISPLIGFSHVSLHVTHYDASPIGAGNQNWAIEVDENGNLFAGNTNGLLTLRGTEFRLYPMPLRTPVRAVRLIDGKIYAGSFEELGYWQKNSYGNLVFHSLLNRLGRINITGEEFWRIEEMGGAIYFQSFGMLLRYHNGKFMEIELPGPMLFLLKTNGKLFIQEIDGGLFEVLDNELVPVAGSEIFGQTEIKALFTLPGNKLLAGTSSEGMFIFDGTSWKNWNNQAEKQLRDYQLNNGILIENRLIIGTILKGVLILDTAGNLLRHLHAGNSLQNNTVLALQADLQNNFWIGMDIGLDYVALNSPVESFVRTLPNLGTVYDAALFENKLYIGTNQGLFYFEKDLSGAITGGTLIPGSQGQVWFLEEIDGRLYCGHNDGTFWVDNNRLTLVGDLKGGFNLKRLPLSYGNFMVQGTYYSLIVYRNAGNVWRQSHVLEGFGWPARFLEVDHLGNIWLGHTLTGIHKIQPSSDLTEVISSRRIGSESGLFSPTNRVFMVDNRIVVLTGENILQWNPVENKFIPFDDIIAQLDGFVSSNMIVSAGQNQYWFFKPGEAALFHIRFGSARLVYRILPQMFDFNLVSGYENIVALNDSLHLICQVDGFSILNLNQLTRLPPVGGQPTLSELTHWRRIAKKVPLTMGWEGIKRLDRGFNNVTISFFALRAGGNRAFFQYKLSGIDNDWSAWTSSTSITYHRLPPGNYTFYVRSIDNSGIYTPFSQVSFRIRAPWFLSAYAYFFYALAVFVVSWLLRLRFLRSQFKKKEEELKAQQLEALRQKEYAENELISMANEKLQAEVEFKNAQLANSTMAIIRKNELLGDIQKELDFQKEELGRTVPKKYFARLQKLIDSSFQSDQDWEQFEKLFYQAHENFFQRLKSQYPDLTPSDLRLCAYLRLNLSTKEIAPLLNISVRGVEERRYRLRKRMNLSLDHNLTEYILAF
ncbi:MAG TPA: triple tyrosine motif-containing protein [Bacteroidales bacterium]|nr:triple tyrosine motif-containing protein [Bacteroidales bacterium]